MLKQDRLNGITPLAEKKPVHLDITLVNSPDVGIARGLSQPLVLL
jgi:hypothetical protein